MYLPLLILIVIIAFALILIIMVQNPKGGGLSSSFGGGNANTIGGVQNTNNFLDRATWVLAIALFGLILLSRFTIDTSKVGSSTPVEEKTTEMDGILEDVKTTTDEEPVKTETKTPEKDSAPAKVPTPSKVPAVPSTNK